ncbi:hypothetical protein CC80DRAFT_120764 [Byssothecium circinans]|uniref:Uncharacterized protein n=1 Tax=Byssothecium circinans TaxID=147558 RepID=A0A6A5U017_9PLEO|nr:hypothetical protein CC80DRAFT_120764 [Byssothecium circinans]
MAVLTAIPGFFFLKSRLAAEISMKKKVREALNPSSVGVVIVAYGFKGPASASATRAPPLCKTFAFSFKGLASPTYSSLLCTTLPLGPKGLASLSATYVLLIRAALAFGSNAPILLFLR